MNKEEAIEYINKIIEQDKKTFDEEGYSVISSKMTRAIETVLKELDNSISKDKIREKLKEYEENYAKCKSEYLAVQITTLNDLLKEQL